VLLNSFFSLLLSNERLKFSRVILLLKTSGLGDIIRHSHRFRFRFHPVN